MNPASDLTIGALLTTGQRAAGGNEIVTRDGPRLGYPAFAERVRRLAGALRGFGIGPGDPVAIMDFDGHRYLEAYFAVPMLGAVLMTVNIRLAPAQIRYTIEHSGAKVALVNGEFLGALAQWCGPGSTLETVVPMDDYEALLAAAPDDFVFPAVPEHATATLFYTTGTTGEPKGVSYSHRQLVLHTLSLAAMLGGADGRQSLRPGDVYMPLTPMFHVHAWGLPYVATMLGLQQVYAGRYEPTAVLALRRAEGVTFSHFVPTVLQMLIAADLDGSALAGWKMLVGGSAVAPALAGTAAARGAHVFVGYGMSETCPVLTIDRFRGDDPAGTSRTATGRAIPLVSLALRLDSGEIVEGGDGGARGELLARAPWLTAGYHRDPAATERLWRDGWLHTGDVATIAADGTVMLVDRLKDVVKTGGEWVSSIEIEGRVREHPAVVECAVIGRADAHWGERPVAFVVLAAGAEPGATEAAIRARLQQHVAAGRLARYAVPDVFLFVDEVPKTSVGKIDKKLLRMR